VDFRLDPVPTFRVSGRVDAPAGAAAGLVLRLMPAGTETLGDGAEASNAWLADDGSFTFLGVPSGAYTLDATPNVFQYQAGFAFGPNRELPLSPPPPGAISGFSGGTVLSGPEGLSYRSNVAAREVWWGRMPVDVRSADIDGLALRLSRGASISGSWLWEEDADVSAAGSAPRIRLEPADGNPSLGMPQMALGPSSRSAERSGTFRIEGLLPGAYVLNVLGPRVKSVTWSGRDHTHRPFDASNGQDIADVVITLTTKTIDFTGVARDEQGRPADAGAVIVFPVERELWSNFGFSPARVKAVATTNNGTYRFQSLPEGDYLVACVDVEQIDGWKDPAFLTKLAPVATRVSLRWGQNATQDLRLAVVK
jgi:hypothetical protein